MSIGYGQQFSDGPYGENYFDIAGPFAVSDLNIETTGDLNLDETVNIQDILIIVGYIMGNIELSDNQFYQGDVNSDSTIDILDIVNIVDMILHPQTPEWNFENEWTGDESYIFIHYDPSVSTSTQLWLSNNKAELLEISPNNVHYFFISSRSQFESDVQIVKDGFDEVLTDLSAEEQTHWKSHLHFVNQRSSQLGNWLSSALSDKAVLAIDSFQQLRQTGYLGNPSNFTGTYLHYLAHEALYFNYELSEFRTDDVFDEVVIFDEEIYTGGWASTISQLVELPSTESLNIYSKMEVELLRGCPNASGNYDDDGCDDYDRIAHLYMCDGVCFNDENNNGSVDAGETISNNYETCESDGYQWEFNYNCYEIARWITPFDRQPHHLTDISPFISSLYPGGQKLIKFQESGWPNSKLTLKLRLHEELAQDTPKEIYPIWNGTVHFNPDYNDNRPPTVFEVPANATKVEFVTYITGHGWGSAGCFNCCEFCNSRHIFTVNGGVYEFERDHPTASSSDHCMQPEMITQGVIPNQYGTWGYGRAGWCPGMDVDPYITEITDFINLGEENIIDYEACRVNGNSCVTAPTCQGDGYCPEVAMSSYIVIYY